MTRQHPPSTAHPVSTPPSTRLSTELAPQTAWPAHQSRAAPHLPDPPQGRSPWLPLAPRLPREHAGLPRWAPRPGQGGPRPRSPHRGPPQLGAAAGSPSAPPLRSKAALQEQWPGPPDSRPPCVCGCWGAGPSPRSPFPGSAWTVSRPQRPSPQNGHQPPPFPPAAGHLIASKPRPSRRPAPRRRPNSCGDFAAGRHAPGARAARGAREAALGVVKRPSAMHARPRRG